MRIGSDAAFVCGYLLDELLGGGRELSASVYSVPCVSSYEARSRTKLRNAEPAEVAGPSDFSRMSDDNGSEQTARCKQPLSMRFCGKSDGAIRLSPGNFLAIRLQSDIPELDLHRRSDVYLHADQSFGSTFLRVVVHDDAHHMAVDQMDQRMAPSDYVALVPSVAVDL